MEAELLSSHLCLNKVGVLSEFSYIQQQTGLV